MPTKLPNGVEVLNLTPHSLYFQCEGGVVVANSDGVLNALPVNEEVEHGQGYTLLSLQFKTLREGVIAIQRLKEQHPNALLVGSSIAAQTYRGDVVSTVPFEKGTARHKRRLVRPDLFTTYQPLD